MKNLLKNLFVVIVCSLAASNAMAQCTPLDTFTKPGLYPTEDSLPCVTKGHYHEYTIYFKNYDTARYNITPGSNTLIYVDTVRVLSIGNLPCGMHWTPNQSFFTRLQAGCILVWGVPDTADANGQYSLNITVSVVACFDSACDLASGGTVGPITVNASSLGLHYNVRLIDSANAVCDTVDTTANAILQSANPSCVDSTGAIYMGIRQVDQNATSLSNYPNPFSGNTEISFTSIQSRQMTLRVFNILGETMTTETIGVNAGNNIIKYDGSKLNAGMYFYSLSDGKQTYTNRMVVIQ